MTNITGFKGLQLHNQGMLVMESFFELTEYLAPPSGRVNWVFVLFYTGWLLSLGTLLISHIQPMMRKRKPSEIVFFAAFQEKLRKTFRAQREDTFQTILMGVNRVMRRNTEEPTVLLVLVPQGAMPTAMGLVTLLVHCTLIASHLPASQSHVQNLLTDGHTFSSHNDEWPFFYVLRRKLRFFGVSAVFSFESLHPQVIKTMQILVPMISAPFPESLLILVADLGNRFTEHQKQTMTPNNLGRLFLEEQLGPYFDQNELTDTLNQIGSRCLLINPETESRIL